jgi:mlo protein
MQAHVSSNNAFNFQNYIQRSLHEDFKTVVGISPLMWLTVVIFMLLDVSGWRVYFYMSFVPLIF